MTCADALLMLLDADLTALSGDNASPLGKHLAGCARCQAVAAGLQADTSRLAAITAAHPQSAATPAREAQRRRAMWLMPLPLAAAAVVAYVVFSPAPSEVAAPAESSVTVARPTPPISAPSKSVGAASASKNIDRFAAGPRAVERASGRIEDESYRFSTPTRLDAGGPLLAESTTPVPVDYDSGSAFAERAIVEVSTSGGRAVVLRPSNTNITVVWFY